MLVHRLSVATPAVHTLSRKLARSQRPKPSAPLDGLESPTRRAGHPLRAAPDVSSALQEPGETPLHGPEFWETLDSLTAQFEGFAERGRYGCAFLVLRKLKNLGTEILELPASNFKQVFALFASLTPKPRSEVAEWLVDLGMVRLEQMASRRTVLKRGAAGLADVHDAIGDALLGWQLYNATSGGDGSGKNFWSSMELTLGSIWRDIAISQRDGTGFRCDEAVSYAAISQFLELQITALSAPFATSGRATTGLVHRFIEVIADTWPDRSIATLPWLTAIAAKHCIDASRVEALVLQKATSETGRGNLSGLALESFSPEQADKLCLALAKNLVSEARSTPALQTPVGFPLFELATVPHWLTRLAASPEARNKVVVAIEKAAATLEERFAGRARMATHLRSNHAAWLFVSGLRTDVQNAAHLDSIVAGLQAQSHGDSWPWQLPHEARGATFAALAKAARNVGLSDGAIRRAWEATQAAAQVAAKASVAEAQRVQAQAAAQLVEARERAQAAKHSTADATDNLRRIRAASVDWAT